MDVSVNIGHRGTAGKAQAVNADERTSRRRGRRLAGVDRSSHRRRQGGPRVSLAEQFGGKKVINMLGVSDAAQVMLEVKIAEVSKTLLDKLGAQFSGSRTSGNFTYSLIANLLAGTTSAASVTRGVGGSSISLARRSRTAGQDSRGADDHGGQRTGRRFPRRRQDLHPVARSAALEGVPTITLEEKEFGVVSGSRRRCSKVGASTARDARGVGIVPVARPSHHRRITSVLPTFTTRRASTTVQLFDDKLRHRRSHQEQCHGDRQGNPGAGRDSHFGVLFRSSEFQTIGATAVHRDSRLVKPLASDYTLPTDKFIAPRDPNSSSTDHGGSAKSRNRRAAPRRRHPRALARARNRRRRTDSNLDKGARL